MDEGSVGGQPSESVAKVREAICDLPGLVLDTSIDSNLYFHAGMIYEGIGDARRAREYLARALALNPGFSVLNADVARRELAKIDAAQALLSATGAGG